MMLGQVVLMKVAARESSSMSVVHEHAAGPEKDRACLQRQRLVCGVLVQMRRCCPQHPISQLLRIFC
jgi:hypothetical protein